MTQKKHKLIIFMLKYGYLYFQLAVKFDLGIEENGHVYKMFGISEN